MSATQTSWDRSNKRVGKLWNDQKHLIGTFPGLQLTSYSFMIENERGILKRLSLSQPKMGRGSTLWEKLCGKIVQQFKNKISLFLTCPFASKTQFYEGCYYMGIVNKHYAAFIRLLAHFIYCMNNIQKHSKLLWARAHLRWADTKWKSVLHSDRCTFQIVLENMDIRNVLRKRPIQIFSSRKVKMQHLWLYEGVLVPMA